MPRLIQLDRGERPQPDDLRLAIQTLAQGGRLAAASDGAYVIAAGLQASQAFADLIKLGAGPPMLLVPYTEDAAPFLERVSERGRRLLRRAWPGPINCLIPAANLADELGSVATELWPSELAISVPAQPALRSIAAAASQPLIAVEVDAPTTGATASRGDWLTAEVRDRVAVAFDSGPPRYAEGATWVRLGHSAGDWEVARPGVVLPHTLARLSAEVFLFVCTGNTCRSPLAEGLLRKRLAERLGCRPEQLVEHGFDVISAGVAAQPGAPASPETVELLRLEGVDLTTHTSQPVTEALLHYADHIFTMTAGHRAALLQRFPDFQGKVRLISSQGDVADPYGGSWHEYRVCRDELVAAIDDLLP